MGTNNNNHSTQKRRHDKSKKLSPYKITLPQILLNGIITAQIISTFDLYPRVLELLTIRTFKLLKRLSQKA